MVNELNFIRLNKVKFNQKKKKKKSKILQKKKITIIIFLIAAKLKKHEQMLQRIQNTKVQKMLLNQK